MVKAASGWVSEAGAGSRFLFFFAAKSFIFLLLILPETRHLPSSHGICPRCPPSLWLPYYHREPLTRTQPFLCLVAVTYSLANAHLPRSIFFAGPLGETDTVSNVSQRRLQVDILSKSKMSIGSPRVVQAFGICDQC